MATRLGLARYAEHSVPRLLHAEDTSYTTSILWRLLEAK